MKHCAKILARQTLARLPTPRSRLSGGLAIHGGAPVRDLRWHPWRSARRGSLRAWWTAAGPELRRVFLSGVEGLPQPLAKKFARSWAEYCGCRYGLLLPHGTDALRIGLAAAFDHDGLDYGGEVIVPNLSFIASATSALDRRFGVALVDVDPATLLIDPKRAEEAIVLGRTRAIMAVHQFGHPADMTALQAIAAKHGLKIIEDAAQAHGAAWETGPVGALGDAAGFSFQSAKTLACGEGGILTTNDADLFARASSIANVGRASDGGGRWEHPHLGWNCRPTEYQAALLLYRFELFEEQQRVRARNFARLRELLPGESAFRPLALDPRVRRHGMYMFVLRYEPEACGGWTLDEALRAVRAEGAPINRLYAATISQQPGIRGVAERRPDYVQVHPTPVADEAVGAIAYIPHDVFLGTELDMVDIAAAINKVGLHGRRI